MTLSFSSTTHHSVPTGARRARWEAAAHEALGQSYELSVVFVGEARMQTINKTTRDKDKPTNILSFPLSDTSGEIFLCVPYAAREAAMFERTPREHLDRLFVHGIAHLAGHDHGPAMDTLEHALYTKHCA